MDLWRAEPHRLRYTNAFSVPALEDCCFKYKYQHPRVGYTRVPRKAWCRNQGSICAHLTLYGTTNFNYSGIITSFNTFGNSVAEAVDKLVKQAIDFIVWRAQYLNLYG